MQQYNEYAQTVLLAVICIVAIMVYMKNETKTDGYEAEHWRRNRCSSTKNVDADKR